MLGSHLVELTQEKQGRKEKEEINNSSEEGKRGNNEEKETEYPVREKTSAQYVMEEERRKEKDGEKAKKEDKEKETEKWESNKVDINNSAKYQEVTPGYQHQRSLQLLQEYRQNKDNQNTQVQIEKKIRTDFQYEIDSDIMVAGAKFTPKPSDKSCSTIDNLNAKVEKAKFSSRRMTCPDLYLHVFSDVLPDTWLNSSSSS